MNSTAHSIEYTLTAQRVMDAIHGALVSRGPNRGILKKQCPPVGTDAAAAWQAITSFANPYKTGLCHMFYMGEDQQEIYSRIRLSIKDSRVDVRGLDRDRKALEEIGAW